MTADSLACFLGAAGGAPAAPAVLDAAAARRVLASLSSDGFVDDGAPASTLGYRYKLSIPVHRNRSIETNASLLDADNNVLLTFRVRAHGRDVDGAGRPIAERAWPDFADDGCPASLGASGCVGLNAFTSEGATPTGLAEVDLNSPEDSARLFGPYPVNRFVRGLEGNAAFLLSPVSSAPPIRTGVLLHTGAWEAAAGWRPPMPMPNSEGCVHAYPESVREIWRLLVERAGVEVRNNTDGSLPYPYVPQGLAAVYEVTD